MSTFGIDRKEKAKGIVRFIRKNKMHFETREIDDIIVYDVKWKFKITDERPVALHDDVKSQLKSGKIHFLFNLRDVEYMDSFGLGEIIASFKSISDLGGKLKLTNLVPRIRLMFETAGLIKVLDIVDDEKTAIKNFSE
jgi:anti-anti-sigma factor